MKSKPILSSDDFYRLKEVANNGHAMDRDTFRVLWRMLETARVLEPEDIPEQVVTMNSRVHLLDPGADSISVWRLVFPGDAAPDNGKLSVLSPLGIAILGRRVGERVECPMSTGWGGITILKISYQPESRLRKPARV